MHVEIQGSQLIAFKGGHLFSLMKERQPCLDAIAKFLQEEPFFSEISPSNWSILSDTLRLKLEDDPRHPTYLETITGVGYRFRQPCMPPQ